MYLWRTQNHLISSLWITNPLEENKKDKSVIGQSYCAITIKTKLYSSKGMVSRTRHISAIKKTIKVVKWYLKTRILNTLKNILRLKIQFWHQNFTIFSGNPGNQSFSPQIFLTIFLVKSKQLKSSKPQHFHEFSPKTIRQFFSGNQSWFFGHCHSSFQLYKQSSKNSPIQN